MTLPQVDVYKRQQRMRARVEQYGLGSLAPHEALEYVLYITNTRKDTNGLAPVSYTHLDVYKRQPRSRPRISCSRPTCGRWPRS